VGSRCANGGRMASIEQAVSAAGGYKWGWKEQVALFTQATGDDSKGD
jgi:hypothetical protein